MSLATFHRRAVIRRTLKPWTKPVKRSSRSSRSASATRRRLVARNREGQPESVRYEYINAMLLNEFLKEHKKVRQLEAAVAQQRNDFEATIIKLKKEIASLATRSKEQDAKIQKVSAGAQLNRA